MIFKRENKNLQNFHVEFLLFSQFSSARFSSFFLYCLSFFSHLFQILSLSVFLLLPPCFTYHLLCFFIFLSAFQILNPLSVFTSLQVLQPSPFSPLFYVSLPPVYVNLTLHFSPLFSCSVLRRELSPQFSPFFEFSPFLFSILRELGSASSSAPHFSPPPLVVHGCCICSCRGSRLKKIVVGGVRRGDGVRCMLLGGVICSSVPQFVII